MPGKLSPVLPEVVMQSARRHGVDEATLCEALGPRRVAAEGRRG